VTAADLAPWAVVGLLLIFGLLLAAVYYLTRDDE
jgi:hypothetical protein